MQLNRFFLFLDFHTNKLYWVAGNKLEFANLDGSSSQLLLTSSSLENIFSIMQFGDFIYWSHTNGVMSYIKRTSKKRSLWSTIETVMYKATTSKGFQDIQVFDSSRQPNATAACDNNKDGCEQLCLPTPYQAGSTKSFACACLEDQVLGSDGFSCEF